MEADEIYVAGKGKLMKTELERAYSLMYRAFMELHELVLVHVPAGDLPEWVCETPEGSLEELVVMLTDNHEVTDEI